MAKSVNKVILLGNVGKDPGDSIHGRRHHGGQPYPGHQRPVPGSAGQLAGPHRVAQPGGLQAHRRNHSRLREEGIKLYIEGKIQTRSWDDKETGAKRYRTEIIVNDLSLLSGREEGSGGYSRPAAQTAASANYDQRPAAGQDDVAQSAEISDDDIPF